MSHRGTVDQRVAVAGFVANPVGERFSYRLALRQLVEQILVDPDRYTGEVDLELVSIFPIHTTGMLTAYSCDRDGAQPFIRAGAE